MRGFADSSIKEVKQDLLSPASWRLLWKTKQRAIKSTNVPLMKKSGILFAPNKYYQNTCVKMIL